ncbi:MAG: VPLPA-CTERM sorting domain-containing protein [Gammaproteobacteria bacterium]
MAFRTYAAAVVPLPAAVWLFGSGLLGLIGIARRRSA